MRLPFRGHTILEEVLAQAAASGLASITVVTGAHAEAIAPLARGARICTVHNPNYAAGMLSSVRCGLMGAPTDADGYMVLLGDQPGISAAVMDRVLEAWAAGPASIAVAAYEGRRGHPLVFAAAHRAEVLSQFDEVGLRGLAHAHAGEVVEVPCPSVEVLIDVDTPDDYARLLGRSAGS